MVASRRQDRLAAIDSDGTALDTMAAKYRGCFIPLAIEWFGLERLSEVATEVGEFVWLNSRHRGLNRFPALGKVLELCSEHPRARLAGFEAVPARALRAWLAAEPAPSNPALERAIRSAARAEREELARVLDWSRAVNAAVAAELVDAAPFPFVRECLERLAASADVAVVSTAPAAELEREWARHGLDRHIATIIGQEEGRKEAALSRLLASGYAPECCLMIGDSPGDLAAARANRISFYPIQPGAEATSWEHFFQHGVERFLGGRYDSAYEDARVAEFLSVLPVEPPWISDSARG